MISQFNKSQNEIEIKILSCIFNSHFETEDIFIELNVQDFFNLDNAKIFLACKKLMHEGKNYSFLDVLDFFNQNQKNKEFYFNNYQEYLETINNQFSYDTSILSLIDIIKKNSVNKQLQNFGQKLSKIEMDVTNYNDKIYEIETQFLEILNSRKVQEIKILKKIIPEYYERFKSLSLDNHETLTGCTSGYAEIDRITHGFQRGDMIVLAARPGMGKTALAINFMLNSAKELHKINAVEKKNKPKAVLMFSMEMGESQICERLVASESCVDINLIRRGTADKVESYAIEEAISRLSDYPILIDDSSNLSIIEIQSKIKQTSLKYDINLVIIDYLQLLKAPQSRGIQTNRQQEVSNISRIIKHIARNENVPIIAIAQLSRKIEERRGEQKRPILSDLRESGSIEQDADIVSFINSKQVDEEKTNTNSNETVVEYIISKHRNGETGIIDFLFKKSIGKYMIIRRE